MLLILYFQQVEEIDRSILNQGDVLNLELFQAELLTFVHGYQFQG